MKIAHIQSTKRSIHFEPLSTYMSMLQSVHTASHVSRIYVSPSCLPNRKSTM